MAAMDAFEACLKFTLEKEGGVALISGDSGGLTNYGVTQATYDSYRAQVGLSPQSVKSITLEEVKDLYYRNYWLPAGGPQWPLALALCMFDTAVHSGPRAAVKMLQEACGASADGQLGQATYTAVKALELRTLVEDFLNLRYRLLIRLTEPDKPLHNCRRGFVNRLRDLKQVALAAL